MRRFFPRSYFLTPVFALIFTLSALAQTTVFIVQEQTLISETDPGSVVLTVRRVGDTTNSLTVPLNVSGNALEGADYEPIPHSVTFAAGDNLESIEIDPINDTKIETTNEFVTVAPQSGAGYTVSPDSQSATVEITDDDSTFPVVSITQTQALIDEGDPGSVTLTVWRTGNTNNPLVVPLTVLGNATNGVDYSAIQTSVTIPAGESSFSFDIDPIDDTIVETTNEFVIVTVRSSANYIDSPDSPRAIVEIADNDSTVPVVSITQTQTLIDEDAEDPVVLTVRRTGNTANPLVVPLTISGTATNGVDYETIQTSVVIPAGESFFEFEINPVDDTKPEGNANEIVTVAIRSSANYNVSPESPSATVEIRDNDFSPVVSIVRAGSDKVEGTANPLEYVFRRTGSTQNSLRINFSVSGIATEGEDYFPPDSFIIIDSGDESALLQIETFQDTQVEGAESVTATITPSNGQPPQYTVSSTNSSATQNILDDDTGPVLNITLDDAVGAEPSNGIVFKVTRTSSGDDPVNVSQAVNFSYEISGTAINGTDYTAISGTATIPSGSESATITVTPIDDVSIETDESVILTLIAPTGSFYSVGTNDTASGTIQDNDSPLGVSVIASISGVPENFLAVDTESGVQFIATGSGEFTFIRSNPTVNSLTINYTVSGSATPGTDYNSLPGTVTFAAGEDRVRVRVQYIGDFIYEGNESVDVQVAAGSGYVIGSPSSASVVISDDESPSVVSVTASDAIASEPSSKGQFAILREVQDSRQLVGDLEVKYEVTGTAANGTDYVLLSGTATINSGSAQGFIDVTPIDDATIETDETIVVTLLTDAGGSYSLKQPAADDDVDPTTATVTLQDNEPPRITLVGTDTEASEPGNNKGVVTFTRSGSTLNALKVSYDVSGSASNGKDYKQLSKTLTIPAGATSATLLVAPINDSEKEKTETVSLKIRSAAGYSAPKNTVTVAIKDRASYKF